MRYLTPLAIVLLFVAVIPAKAQTDRAILEGTITDQSGATVPGASIKITEMDTGTSQEAKSNGHGYYLAPGLAIGRYSVSVSKAGFNTKVISDVILRVGEGHALDVGLELGPVSQRVDVQAQVNPAEHTSAADASVISNQEITNLPVNGRDWSELTLLAPFAQDEAAAISAPYDSPVAPETTTISASTAWTQVAFRNRLRNPQSDCKSRRTPSTEYRVNSALYDAEYGTQAGGQINVVTKSGTNDFHGTVFGYLRNSVFDARNFNDFDVNGKPCDPSFPDGTVWI